MEVVGSRRSGTKCSGVNNRVISDTMGFFPLPSAISLQTLTQELPYRRDHVLSERGFDQEICPKQPRHST
jgi:hypothetical protein